MCGDHHSRDVAGGALAVMSPSPFTTTASIPMAGRLVFYNRTAENPIATHAMLTVDSSRPSTKESFLVRIHETGDLTKPASTSPSWASFTLQPVIGESTIDDRTHAGLELGQPFKIEVGSDGIIGRRVSVWTQKGVGPIAEGIVGYN
ncbi:hypothetical protein F5B22DRAFT_1062 [Xylaria bambusicola]|uniref:uncharacterized protein n=1 Tax=Xylaria bambusicola TaxID=326684 RepID=UPI00200891CF|nr:uncharacterized protein F5B22DRAFT_1062 [Xylaria bambusicola]KAI0527728.1 hypothetical protein F5B22DRAFT_1062 [Xylaria bambusicola]